MKLVYAMVGVVALLAVLLLMLKLDHEKADRLWRLRLEGIILKIESALAPIGK